jgi:hypothetical protein
VKAVSDSVKRGAAVSELLSKAKDAIASGDRSYREAAEYIADAQAQGATQRTIAAKLGKSAAWVNRLLAWRAGGFIGDAFDRAHRKRFVQPAEQTAESADHAESAAFDSAESADSEADEAERRFNEWFIRTSHQRQRVNMFDFYGIRRLRFAEAKDRDILVRALGMLGSDQPGEVLNAARVVEKQRRKLNITWDDLIIPAPPDAERDLAA